MEKQTFSVPNISCEHCVMTIKNELGQVNGVHRVDGDPDGKSITVEWETPATTAAIKAKLKDIGYPAA